MTEHWIVGGRGAKLVADPKRAEREENAERHRHGEEEGRCRPKHAEESADNHA
jgi:hypothetical protein